MKLNFKKVGSGPPLVILHGLFGSADNWFSIARELQESFTLYLVDQRNHGDSPQSDEWNYQVMAEDLLELLDDEGLSSVYLMGHSMGGKTAMNFALEYPDRVAKLIVADIAPRYYPVHHQSILKGLNSLPLGELQSRKEADEKLAEFIPEAGIRQFLLKSLGRDESGFVWKINLPVITKNIEEVGQALESEEKFEGKTLFLAGAKSDYVTDADCEDIYSFFPNYQLIKVPNAGHWLHAEQPTAVIREIKNFLN
ncbi:alpha/beta fold hydrolase [Algoriphagus namhaensis]|uniref:Alpha/beta fold hydrolase n=1 Tax=Algoriphagus namhaensis TaxID=915353 RepID=A0ABV8AMD5_9BACT